MQRAALYARVSTRRQEQEATIESQLDRLLSYARQHDYDIPSDSSSSTKRSAASSWPAPGWIGCGMRRPPVRCRPCCA